MATRFNIGQNNSLIITDIAPAFSSGWDSTAVADRLWMYPTKLFTGSNNKGTTPIGVINTNILTRQYISTPIAAQTISGTIKGQQRCRENGGATDDLCMQFRAYVIDSDYAMRGVLYELDNSALSNEFSTSLINRKIPRGWVSPGNPITNVVSEDNDLIIFEIGLRSFSTTVAVANNTFQTVIAGTDLPENETTSTALDSWVELSADISFMPSPASTFTNSTPAGAGTGIGTVRRWQKRRRTWTPRG